MTHTRGRSVRRAACGLLMAATFAFAPTPAQADWDTKRVLLSVVDLAAFRPMSLAATVCGAVVLLVVSPVLNPLDKMGEAVEPLVMDPLRQTFRRPLGEWP